jgi:hypothetical protein
MIGRFLTLVIFFVIVIGLILHFDVDVPGVSDWIGHLPGDLILQKGSATIYLPFVSSAIFSSALSLLGSMFSSKN